MCYISRIVGVWDVCCGCKELFYLCKWNRFALLRSVQREIYYHGLIIDVKFDVLNHHTEAQQSGFN